MKKKLLPSLIGIIGIGLTSFAIFANWFGLDMENDWENGRVSVLALGITLILLTVLTLTAKYWKSALNQMQSRISTCIRNILGWSPVRKLTESIQRKLSSWKAVWKHTPFVGWYSAKLKEPLCNFGERIRNSRIVQFLSASQGRKVALVAILTSIVVIVIYVWYISMGLWTEWPTTTTYYTKLADAFWHKQVNLLVEPHPSLAALDDPYEIENRQGYPYLWDAVFYDGKFFLYWGPVPALVLTLVRVFFPGEVGDQYLVFAFVCGGLLVSIFLLLKLRSHLFPNLNWRWMIPAILLAGLANPIPWMLNRPAVYEAAVSGGQFFLLVAMYLGFSYVADEQYKSYWKLVIIGLCLGLSAASRTSLLPTLVFLLMMVAWAILRRPNLNAGRKLLSLSSLGIPFAAGLASLGWYNFVRFGSFLEFGLRYQLSTWNQNALYDSIFSWANVPINLYTYLANPFAVNSVFPFIRTFWTNHFLIYPIKAPAYYSLAEPVSGLLFDTPYILLACFAIFFLVQNGIGIKHKFAKKPAKGNELLSGTLLTLAGASVLAFTPILFFFSATMRYLGDSIPTMILLSTLGSWVAYTYLIQKPGAKKWFIVLLFILTILSVAISILLGISGMDNRLEKVNPTLYYHLVELLSFK